VYTDETFSAKFKGSNRNLRQSVWKELSKQVPQHNILLAFLIFHCILGEVIAVGYCILAEFILALEYPHTRFAASLPSPLDEVDDINVSISNNLHKVARC